jgi:hypothetical protein
VKPIERVPAVLDGTVQLDHQLHAPSFGRLRYRPLAHIDTTIHGRHQKHSLDPIKRPRQRLGAIHVSDHQLGTRSLQLGSSRSLADERTNRLPGRKEALRHTAAEHAGRPRDKNHSANPTDALVVHLDDAALAQRGTAATWGHRSPEQPRGFKSTPTSLAALATRTVLRSGR